MGVSILSRILDDKRREIETRKGVESLEALQQRARRMPPPRRFAEALRRAAADRPFAIIAEIKKASPSKGLIRPDLRPAEIAGAYERGGAACLSVLTDETYFQGSLSDLQAARAAAGLPALRKDFTIDPYQVYESRAAGADAILLIAAALTDEKLEELFRLARELGLDALIEVHDRAEMERALRLEPDLIGVNNRNLKTLEVSLETTRALLPLKPPGAVLVSESGFSRRRDLEALRRRGVDAFLIGESLMRAADPGQALSELMSGPPAEGSKAAKAETKSRGRVRKR